MVAIKDLNFPTISENEIETAINNTKNIKRTNNKKNNEDQENEDTNNKKPVEGINLNEENDDYLLKKQRFDLIKEMDALFITAKTKIGQKEKLNIGDNFKASGASIPGIVQEFFRLHSAEGSDTTSYY